MGVLNPAKRVYLAVFVSSIKTNRKSRACAPTAPLPVAGSQRAKSLKMQSNERELPLTLKEYVLLLNSTCFHILNIQTQTHPKKVKFMFFIQAHTFILFIYFIFNFFYIK